MNEIFNRVSVRKFSDKDVTKDEIIKMIEAGQAAPTSKNVKPSVFYVVKNKKVLDLLSKAAPNAAPCRNANVAIVVCGDNSLELNDYIDINLSACTENILLEATSLGLGAVWLGIRPKEDRVKNVGDILELPENITAFSIIAIGHKTREYDKKNRLDETKITYLL